MVLAERTARRRLQSCCLHQDRDPRPGQVGRPRAGARAHAGARGRARSPDGSRRSGRTGRRECSSRPPAAGVRTCIAAMEEGMEIDGTLFVLGGEPYTRAKAAVIEKTGSRAACHYAMAEAGAIGIACGAARCHRRRPPPQRQDRDDSARQTGRAPMGSSVRSLLHTTLLPATPKLMLNVESGDYGVREARRCGCGALPGAFTTHLHTIRSHEKLTSEGMSFLGSDLLGLMEEVLPARFGGDPTDYQLVEGERAACPGSPSSSGRAVGELDEGRSCASAPVLPASRGQGQRLMTDVWDAGPERCGSCAASRYVTPGGKILPLRTLGRVARMLAVLPVGRRCSAADRADARRRPASRPRGLESRGRWEIGRRQGDHVAVGHLSHASTRASRSGSTASTRPFPWSASDQRVRFIHTFPKPPTIWDRLSRRGRRAADRRPHTLPGRRVDMAGVYLSGWQFKDRMVMQGRVVPRGERARSRGVTGAARGSDDVYGKPRAATSLLALREHLVSGPGRAADAAIDCSQGPLRAALAQLQRRPQGRASPLGSGRRDRGERSKRSSSHAAQRARGRVRGRRQALGRNARGAAGRCRRDRLLSDRDGRQHEPRRSAPGHAGRRPRARTAPRLSSSAGRGSRTPVWSLRSSVPSEWRTGWLAASRPIVADLTTRLYMRADWPRTRAMAVPGECQGLRAPQPQGPRARWHRRSGRGRRAHGEDRRRSDDVPRTGRLRRDRERRAMAEPTGATPMRAQLPDLVVLWEDASGGGAAACQLASLRRGRAPGIGSGRSGHHNDDAWAMLVPGARDRGRAAGPRTHRHRGHRLRAAGR